MRTLPEGRQRGESAFEVSNESIQDLTQYQSIATKVKQLVQSKPEGISAEFEESMRALASSPKLSICCRLRSIAASHQLTSA